MSQPPSLSSHSCGYGYLGFFYAKVSLFGVYWRLSAACRRSTPNTSKTISKEFCPSSCETGLLYFVFDHCSCITDFCYVFLLMGKYVVLPFGANLSPSNCYYFNESSTNVIRSPLFHAHAPFTFGDLKMCRSIVQMDSLPLFLHYLLACT